MKIMKFERSSFLGGLALAGMAFSGCSSSSVGQPREREIEALTELCQALQDVTIYGAPRDAIPALTDPTLVAATDDEADYLLPTDRVIGLNLPSGFLAVPHNILWWHEIVNLTDSNLAVTYCPLTGSSMVFHRAAVDGANFGVSGLLFKNNLIMFDRKEFLGEPTTLWPQMLAAGRCGPLEPKALTMFPIIEIEWEDWVELHPDTRVVSKRTGISRLYRADLYPYGDYEVEDNASFLYPVSNLDLRRPPKERVLGIPDGEGGGIAFPFGVLRDLGDIAAIHVTFGGSEQESPGTLEPMVVFWDKGAEAAMAYQPWVGSTDLTFEVVNGVFVDLETGSEWSIDGHALSGPLAGQRLGMIREAYVSFWFAFAAFFPDPVIWTP